MLNKVQILPRLAILLSLAGVILGGCGEAPTAPLTSEATTYTQGANSIDVGTTAKRAPAVYQYLVGDEFLCEVPVPNACPDKAVASNGETMELVGQGILGVHPKLVDGGGTFVHKDAGGNVLGSGTWTATQLVSFVDFGPSTDPIPREFRGGIANIRVELVADGGAEFEAILRIQCHLTGVIPEIAEGSRINVQGGSNFNKIVSGLTLFILQP